MGNQQTAPLLTLWGGNVLVMLFTASKAFISKTGQRLNGAKKINKYIKKFCEIFEWQCGFKKQV